MTQELDLSIDWQKAAKEAVVYGQDGTPVQPRTMETELAPANTQTLFQQVQGHEVRTPSYHVPIERITEKIGRPTIHRSTATFETAEAIAAEAVRVREAGEQAKQDKIAAEFLLTPQGKRIVSLEETVASLESKLDKILAAVEAKPRTTAKKTSNGNRTEQTDETA